MKTAILAPVVFAAICTIGLASGALAAPRRFHAVEVSAVVVGADVSASETASDGNARQLLAFTRSSAPSVQSKVWTCGAWEASAVGGSYKRCEVQ